ncbi:MAG: hypothetical protein PSX81_03735 [bacterium]|nr:hypothetical protein [bacterium]
MNKSIQIFLHSENTKEPKLVDVAENATVDQICMKNNEVFHNPDDSEVKFLVFNEDEDAPIEKKMGKIENGKRPRIHCHRCSKVDVSVNYMDKTISLSSSPSFTIHKIRFKAAKELNISEADAADLVIMFNNEVLSDTSHIGSYVSYPDCKIKLSLVPDKRVNG